MEEKMVNLDKTPTVGPFLNTSIRSGPIVEGGKKSLIFGQKSRHQNKKAQQSIFVGTAMPG